jgi:hypothetical protein
MEARISRVIMPMGPEAGRAVKLVDALTGLAIEMMAQVSDLREKASRHNEAELECSSYLVQAEQLERYAVAINGLALQAAPENWKPAFFTGLLELAKQYCIPLPDWMTKE